MRTRPTRRMGGWEVTLRVAAAITTLAAAATSVNGFILPQIQTQETRSSTSADRPRFDVASVKPNKSGDNRNGLQYQPGGRFTATNHTLRNLIFIAYQPGIRRTIEDPKWNSVLSAHFDIVANAEGNPTGEQTRLMLQSLLADRFKLVVHFETRPIPVYALVLANPGKIGPGLKPHSDDVKCIPVGPQQQGFGDFPTPWCGEMRMAPVPGGVRQIGNKVTADRFANLLALSVDRVVVDRTGLSGYFDSDFEYAFTQGQGGVPRPSVEASDPSAPPSIFTAMQEQLGLKLEARTEPLFVLVIDHVEEPSEN
jgi:uncharacterized protein (TIGR03435 family)